MPLRVRIYIVIACMVFALVCSLLKLRTGSTALKWLCAFLGISMLTETAALYASIRFHFNLYVYNLLNPVTAFCAVMYFSNCNPLLVKHHRGWWIAFGSLLFAIVNTFCFQPIHTLNSNFTSFECVLMSALALLYFYQTFYDDHTISRNDPHFWLAFLFLLYYAGTFLIRASVDIVKHYTGGLAVVHNMYLVIFLLVVLFYSGIGIILLRSKSFQP